MKLQLARNIIMTIPGPVTGKIYVFNGIGSVVEVDDKDGKKMNIKRANQPCCSGGEPAPYFFIVEEPKITSTRRT